MVALVQAVYGRSRQGNGDGDERVESERCHGLVVARNKAVDVCERDRPEASGDLPLDLGHPDVAFRPIVRERRVGAPCEAQDVPSLGGVAVEEDVVGQP